MECASGGKTGTKESNGYVVGFLKKLLGISNGSLADDAVTLCSVKLEAEAYKALPTERRSRRTHSILRPVALRWVGLSFCFLHHFSPATSVTPI